MATFLSERHPKVVQVIEVLEREYRVKPRYIQRGLRKVLVGLQTLGGKALPRHAVMEILAEVKARGLGALSQ